MDLFQRRIPDPGASEKALLVQFLDDQRAAVAAKAHGVDAAGTAQTVAASPLTLGGLVKHLTLVEHSWFEHRFVGAPEEEPWASVDWDADPDWEFRVGATEPMADLLEAYAAVCGRANAIIAGSDLDDRATWSSPNPELGRPTLRWIVLHMIEETARHAGHADLLRESVDGVVGT